MVPSPPPHTPPFPPTTPHTKLPPRKPPMDIEQRIEQFQRILESDDSNDMAWFSLAGAYNQSGRYTEAADAYLKCTELNPTMSKAYQLAGAALHASEQDEKAKDVLTRGYTIAAERGDLMPQKAMGELLEKLGADVPQVASAKPAEPEPAGDFKCQASGRMGSQLPRPPFRGPVGDWIYQNISKQTFDEWIGLGTKIINELRLDLSRDEHEAVYDYAMRKFIGLTDDTYRNLTGNDPSQPAEEFANTIDMVLERSGQLETFQGDLHKGVN